MPKLLLDGRPIGYECQPRVFDVDKTVLALVHGTGGDREDWRRQIEGIKMPGSVIALELPGHGASDPPGENSISAYSAWVERFVDVMGLSRVILVGCSLGSAIALKIAVKRKPWLVGLGLVGSGARLRVHPLILEGLTNDPLSSLKKLAEYCLSTSSPDDLKTLMVEKYSRANPMIIHGDLTACDKFDIMSQLNEISIPTLIVVGENDALTPVKYSKYLNDNIKSSTLARIPEAGHLVMIEKPEEFNSVLQSFVDRI